jgi:hypothetical protein
MLLSTRQTILSLLLRTVPAGYTRPVALDNLQIGLFSTLPADDGTGGVELAGNGYARTAVAVTDANFALAGDQVTNVNVIQGAALFTGNMLEAVGFGVWDNAGTLRWAQPAGDLALAFTFNGATDTFTRAGHGLADRATVRAFALDGLPLPGGLAANTTYFVRSSAANTLQLAATEGGAAIDITSDGAVNLRRWYGKTYGIDDRWVIPAGGLKFRLIAP